MITMRDVAERAGVSITTVSHVINNTRPVSDELRRRVLAAMQELDYQPNLLARSLRRGQTHTIGVIVPDSANPYFADVTRGIEDASFEQGYSVILCNSDGDTDKEQMYTDVLVEKQVDGILFVSIALNAEQVCSLQDRDMPVVMVNRDIPCVAVDMVLADNAHGGYLATRHLVELGHGRIGCITGPSDVTPSAERVDGYRQALQEAALPLDGMLIVKGNYQYEGGYHAARQLLLMKQPPTGIFACNDLMAVGAMRAAQELGRQIPIDLSVVGYDDIQLASFTTPPLTTISQPRSDIGVIAATMLLERMHDWDLPPRRRVVDIGLRVRQSTVVRAATIQESMS